jgi:GT2 family glycosyltransferase
VVVVDNAPTGHATRDVVALFPGVRYIVEPRPGLSAARNAGLAAATGEVLAFTDDDVVVHPAWVGRLQQAFDGSDALAVTGLVLPAALESQGQLLFELHMGGFGHDYRALAFDQRWFAGMRHLGSPVWRIGAGANMAFRRAAFELVGGFDERLGAGAAGCSEDSELWYRLLAAGHTCQYEPAAVVYHHHRSDVESVRRQARAYMDGHVAALFVQCARHRHPGNVRRALVTLPRYYAGRLRRARHRPDLTLGPELRGFAGGLRRAPRLLRAPAAPGGSFEVGNGGVP